MIDSSEATPDLTRNEALIALAVATAVAMLVLWPVVFIDRFPIPADAVDRVEPWRSEAPSPLADGAVWNPLITDSLWQVVPEGVASNRLWATGPPLWDPNPACGMPGFAQGRMYSNAIFNLLAMAAGPIPAIGWTALIQLAMALWGGYLLPRQLGVIPAAAAVGAVSFGLNLYLLVWLPHTSFFGAIVWLPLLFFTFERTLATGRWSWMAPGSAVFAVQILEGHIATPFFGAVTLGLWAVVRSAVSAIGGADVRQATRPIAIAAGVLCVGALLAAPQLLATAELYFESPRGAAVGENAVVEFEQGLRIVAPWFWGHRFDGGTYVGPFNVAELGLYFGLVPLALIALAPAGSRRLEGCFFAAMTLLLGLVVFDLPPLRAILGWLYPILYQSFPGRVFAIAALCGSVAAALGAHWLLVEADRRWRLRWVAAALLGAVAIWALAAWVGVVHRPAAVAAQGGAPWIVRLEITRIENLLWAGCWLAAGAAVVFWAVRQQSRRPWLVWAPAVVAAMDLLHTGMWTIPFFAPSAILPPTPTTVRLAALLAESEDQFRMLPIPSQQIVPGQVPTFLDLPSVSSYSSWPLTRYDRFASLTGERYLRWPFIYFDDCCSLKMNSLAPRFLVAPEDLQPRSAETGPRFRLLWDGPVTIRENPRALPRARLVGAVRWAPPDDHDEVVGVLNSRGFDLRREVVLEGEGEGLGPPGGLANTGSATIVRDLPTTVEIEVDARRPAVLVLADTWYPGWRATVNGRTAEVHPANLALRGVVVPAGRSTVVFRYRPGWVLPGAVLSLLGLVTLLGMLRVGRSAGRRTGSRGAAPT